MTPDLVNGLFELVGGLLLLLHCRRLLRDKEVKGVSLPPALFFLGWGYWNMYFYPNLGQWWSFAGGLVVVSANTLWVGLMVWYEYVNPKNGGK